MQLEYFYDTFELILYILLRYHILSLQIMLIHIIIKYCKHIYDNK